MKETVKERLRKRDCERKITKESCERKIVKGRLKDSFSAEESKRMIVEMWKVIFDHFLPFFQFKKRITDRRMDIHPYRDAWTHLKTFTENWRQKKQWECILLKSSISSHDDWKSHLF